MSVKLMSLKCSSHDEPWDKKKQSLKELLSYGSHCWVNESKWLIIILTKWSQPSKEKWNKSKICAHFDYATWRARSGTSSIPLQRNIASFVAYDRRIANSQSFRIAKQWLLIRVSLTILFDKIKKGMINNPFWLPLLGSNQRHHD